MSNNNPHPSLDKSNFRRRVVGLEPLTSLRPVDALFPGLDTPTLLIERSICVVCHRVPCGPYEDILLEREYLITGLCAQCQKEYSEWTD